MEESLMNLVFIPVWLEKVLEANGQSLSFALETENLTRILSMRDLDLYRQAQSQLFGFLPEAIGRSFKNVTATCVNQNLDSEEKRGYLYGFLPGSEDLNSDPKFTATHVGYDSIVLTVAKESTLPDNNSVYLMEAIIGILTNVQPLEEVAKLPIMEAWLKAAAIK
jgi:hypothetical protein